MVCQVSDRPGVDKEPRVRDLNVPRRAAAVASAQNATSEDPFVKSKRSLDVGDGEKVCDGKPVLRRHLIAFLSDLCFAHGGPQFRCGFLRLSEYVGQCALATSVGDGIFGQERSPASAQGLERTDRDINRRIPAAASACQIAPCHD